MSTRRSTSPLTESEDERDGGRSSLPLVQNVIIARPLQAQIGFEHKVNLPEKVMVDIRDVISKVAPTMLDVSQPYTRQDPAVLKAYTAHMLKQFPRLGNYEHNWALQGFTTNFLKLTKEKMVKRSTTQMLADINAVVKQ
ncbi:hypothetical protein B0H12DRAFT_1080063 [Mycena haematopus]|nr:hypothetical protein B0H12DRAFT_1080063 [Mycena haematopus]